MSLSATIRSQRANFRLRQRIDRMQQLAWEAAEDEPPETDEDTQAWVQDVRECLDIGIES